LHDGALDANEQRELDAFLAAGDAPLVFALGSSAVWIAGDFWQHAIEATHRLGQRAILIVGPAQLGSLPRDVRAFAYLPYSAVFRRARAVIHQGGIGTLSQALRAGRPQLIVPFAFDQPDNARRAAELGVARVLPAKRVNAQGLGAELREVIENTTCAARAKALAAQLSETDGAARAAEELARR
jgi:rhamnosyltransferase subunit B